MSSYFDTPVSRYGTDSLKWHKYAGKKSRSGQDILPLWVADMDFTAPDAVITALQERICHGVFGYGYTTAAFKEAIIAAMQRDYHWQIETDWIIPLPGVISGLNVAARCIGEEGDTIVTSTPVYPPLFTAPTNAHKKSVRLPLKELSEAPYWTWDINALQSIHTAHTKGLFLCHPHNPIGRVWNTNELNAIAQHAQAHNLIVVSDEIHCDLILEPSLKHQPFAALSEDTLQRTITLMAPSKTYNIPGLGTAFALIANPQIRQQFLSAMQGFVPHPDILGVVACTAAYQHGQTWRSEVLQYLRQNRERVMTLNHYRGLNVIKPEATYLAWLDCRALPISNPQQFFEEAGVGLSPGSDFEGSGFVRLNFACSSQVLTEALHRIRQALDTLPT